MRKFVFVNAKASLFSDEIKQQFEGRRNVFLVKLVLHFTCYVRRHRVFVTRTSEKFGISSAPLATVSQITASKLLSFTLVLSDQNSRANARNPSSIAAVFPSYGNQGSMSSGLHTRRANTKNRSSRAVVFHPTKTEVAKIRREPRVVVWPPRTSSGTTTGHDNQIRPVGRRVRFCSVSRNSTVVAQSPDTTG